MSNNIFADAEIIHTYSRRQAIEDGVLVDLNQGELAEVVSNAGLKFPIAVTQKVWGECFALTPAAKRMCNDVKGRAWDVLQMFTQAVRSVRNEKPGRTTIFFQVYVVIKRIRPTLVALKAVVGPGDNGEPVITIMYPEES